ncbi:cbb3-type cytochrome c oxidase subunit 3 [Echinicola sp. CAU 1574]|uniref:Cbb3-type cytochrome c oxidase subunit 3 n=1 Tax=Echinicola arenosa TaxID=2774144 RepID=A0ABR9AFU5_9BACT|nr:cbb3-type cytochrome c oxidase subunit 3 [Echinicola arenosa]MBD8487142.1 cbb3-type cytochrome c oxidase subunit 3 [Echinicola arenosa]
MQKEILSSIENVEIYPIISLIIFVLFFVGMGWWVFRVDTKYIDHMKSLPVDGDHQKKDDHEEK